jgi:hypothetical protein
MVILYTYFIIYSNYIQLYMMRVIKFISRGSNDPLHILTDDVEK